MNIPFKKLLIALPVLLLVFILLCVLAIALPASRTFIYQQAIQQLNNTTDWQIDSTDLSSRHIGHLAMTKLSVSYKPSNAELITSDNLQLDIAWKKLFSKQLLVRQLSTDYLWINGQQDDWPVEKEQTAKSKKSMDQLASDINQYVDQLVTLKPDIMPPVIVEKLSIIKFTSEPKIPELAESLLLNGSIDANLDLPAYQANLNITIDANYDNQILPAQQLQLHLDHNNEQAQLTLKADSISQQLLQLLSKLDIDHSANLHLHAHTATKPNRIILDDLRINYGEGVLRANAELLDAAIKGNLNIKNFPLAFIPVDLKKPIDDFELQYLNTQLDFDAQINQINNAFANGHIDATGRLENKAFTLKSKLNYQAKVIDFNQLSLDWAKANMKGEGKVNIATEELSIDLQKTFLPFEYLSDFEIYSPYQAIDLNQGYLDLSDTRISGTFKKPIIETAINAKANIDNKPLLISGNLLTDLNKISLTPLKLKREKTRIDTSGNIYLDKQSIDLKATVNDFDSRDFPTLFKHYLKQDYILANLDLTALGQWDNPLANIALSSKGQYAKTTFSMNVKGNHDTKTLFVPELSLNIIDKNQTQQQLMLKADAQVQGVGLTGLNANNFNALANVNIKQADLGLLKALQQTDLYNSIVESFSSLDEHYRYEKLGGLSGQFNLGLNNQQLATAGNIIVKQPFSAINSTKTIKPLIASLKWTSPAEQLKAKANISGLDFANSTFLNVDSSFKLDQVRRGLMDVLQGKAFKITDVDGELNGNIDLILARLFLNKDIQALTGLIDFNTEIKGESNKPNINGVIKTTNTAYSDKFLGINANNIDLQLNLKNQQVAITQGLIEFEDAGNVKLAGTANWQKQIVDLQATFDEANLINQSGLEGQLSGKVNILGEVKQPTITGNIDIKKLDVFLDQLVVSSIDTIKVTKVKSLNNVKDSQTTEQAFAKLDINISANNNLFVRGYGIEAELAGNIGLKGLSNNLQTVGSFNLIRGDFKWLEQRFILEQMNIAIANSALSLLVNGQAETDEYTYNVHLGGGLDNLDFKLSSTPELPQDEILARIMFGKPLQQMTAVQGLQLAAAVNSLKNGGVGVLNTPREKMGLDSFSIDQETNEDGESSLSLGFGKYLTEKTYLQVKRVDDKQNPWKARIEQQLNKQLSAEAYTGGKSGLGGVKLNWKKNY